MTDILLNYPKFNSTLMKQVESLLSAEWTDFSFTGYHGDLPAPIAATIERGSSGSYEQQLVAGLAYTFFKAPNGDQDVVWVNALAVDAAYRGQGVASQLIQQAIINVASNPKQYPQSHLYVYTDVPRLYANIGFSKVDADAQEGHQVMAYLLPRTEHTR
ncbi:GNAT family N-acetyltransferase [Vibrio ulleungensis]|uniref:GNAT family N-acetyltransferase n=1 Tax=Vibrio ulleungensis TaxID=2807619 RepID=A0ABS2HH42_9VIBR|nr:GNAT family N-acetyltransferase [Vibrio ulleungensis]MBM7035483.1 GNAT family N-acetyltransferase [Vibrio ulleungensis]